MDEFDFDTSEVDADELEMIGVDVADPAQDANLIVSATGQDIGRFLFFDIETIPDESRAHLFDDGPAAEVVPVEFSAEELLGGTVDGLKKFLDENAQNISAEQLDVLHAAEKQRQKPRSSVLDMATKLKAAKVNAVGARLKKLSTTPEYCRIAAIGWAQGMEAPSSLLATNDDEERELLRQFWDLAERCQPFVGYFIAGFDLPVIFTRSIILGVKQTRYIDLRNHVLDLMLRRYPRGGALGLKTLARLYGIPVPAEGVDGSQVYELMQTDPQKVLEYVQSDVCISQRLYARWTGYYCH